MIKAIQGYLGAGNITVSREFSKDMQKSLRNMRNVNRFAYKNDLAINFSPARSGDANKVNMDVSRMRISHVTEVPDVAMKLDTGDRTFINWEEPIHSSEVSKMSVPILDTLMKIVSRGN